MKHSQTFTDRHLYIHRTKDTNEVFYVGCGDKFRPTNPHNRNKYWNEIANKRGWYAEVIEDSLTKEQGGQMEAEMIEYYGLENLTNIRPGGYTGYELSQDHKDRISQSNKGKVLSSLTKAKIAEGHYKPVHQYSKSGEYIKTYTNIKDANKDNKTTGIYNVLCGNAKSSGGYKWSLTLQEVI